MEGFAQVAPITGPPARFVIRRPSEDGNLYLIDLDVPEVGDDAWTGDPTIADHWQDADDAQLVADRLNDRDYWNRDEARADAADLNRDNGTAVPGDLAPVADLIDAAELWAHVAAIGDDAAAIFDHLRADHGVSFELASAIDRDGDSAAYHLGVHALAQGASR